MFDKIANKKLMDRFFRPADNVVWDLMSGKIGLRTDNGIVTMEGIGDEAEIVINMFDQFGVEIPAFAQQTPVESITAGDMIYGAKGLLGWVTKKKEKTFELMKVDGTRGQWTPPKTQLLGFDAGVLVLRSLVSILPSGSGGLAGMQNMLLPMLMMGDGDIDLGNMMPVLLMSQMGAATTNPDGTPVANPMAGMQNMMPMMMMMSMMKGENSPFGSKAGNSSKSYFDMKTR